MYDKVLVVGANSYIAFQTIPFLEIDQSILYLATRTNVEMESEFAFSNANYIHLEEYNLDSSIHKLSREMNLSNYDRLLIINFVGNFGSLSRLTELDLNNLGPEIESNLIPFVCLCKLLTLAGAGSLLLTFSGAGIGGDRLDQASYSYLASKAAMMFLVEAFDNELKGDGKRVGAVAPGAFPSRMQKVVANSSQNDNASPERISEAKKVLGTPADASKLIKILNFLIKNPSSAGGRIWSANHDNPFFPDSTSRFGKLRRKYD